MNNSTSAINYSILENSYYYQIQMPKKEDKFLHLLLSYINQKFHQIILAIIV